VAWYNSTTEQYALIDEEHPQANLDIKIMINNVVTRQKPAFVLDLGCGTGRYFSFLRGETIVGVDLSIEMLKHAKKLKFKNIGLIRADIYHLPLRKGIFDLIISMSIIGECTPFDLKLLQEIRFVLRSTGTFLFTVIPLHHLLLPFKKYLMFFIPLQIFKLVRGENTLFCFGTSKLEIKNKLRRLGLEIAQIKERHGISYPHLYSHKSFSSKVKP
jgi:SAM-dependent methyltransferase